MTHPGSLHINYTGTLVFVVGASARRSVDPTYQDLQVLTSLGGFTRYVATQTSDVPSRPSALLLVCHPPTNN